MVSSPKYYIEPLGRAGVVFWDENGNKFWENNKYSIIDCYALNIDEAGLVWFYYYDSFKLVCLGKDSDIVFNPRIKGADVFLISTSGKYVIMSGGYGDTYAFYRMKIKGSKLGIKKKIEFFLNEKNIEIQCCWTLGSKILLLREDGKFCGYKFK